ncbi:winged helix-turn-helix transcriptional regulator [Streptomyces sp. SAS_275]|uniref:winged helix-turn-helix transcriptional regulator n=1 Tax=Streptomyces sp. SAS_275 TaxID=3412746 RepID=UPI00403C5089
MVGDRWSLLALREVLFGNRRFSQIARNTGAPRDRLAARLKSLVEDGLLERRPYQASRFEYYLTESGMELFHVLTAIMTWGDRWINDTAPMLLEHHGHRIDAMTVCRACGEEVTPADLDLVSNAPGWTLSGPVQSN